MGRRGSVVASGARDEGGLGLQTLVAKAEIGGRHVGGAMRQEARRGSDLEGLALGKIGLDLLDRSVARADEEIGDTGAGQVVENAASSARNLSSTMNTPSLRFSMPAELDALAAAAGRGLIDEAGALIGLVIQDDKRRLAALDREGLEQLNSVKDEAEDRPDRHRDQAPVGPADEP